MFGSHETHLVHLWNKFTDQTILKNNIFDSLSEKGLLIIASVNHFVKDKWLTQLLSWWQTPTRILPQAPALQNVETGFHCLHTPGKDYFVMHDTE